MGARKVFIQGEELNASDLNAAFKFGGTGADGDVTISADTDIDCGGAQYLVKNYETLTINATKILGVTNTHANGTLLHLKVRGNCVINGKINLKGKGGGGGGTTTGEGTGADGYNGAGALNLKQSYLGIFTNENYHLEVNFSHGGLGGGSGSQANQYAKYCGGGGGGGGIVKGTDGGSTWSTNSYGSWGWSGQGGQPAQGADGGYLTMVSPRFILVACGGGGGAGGNAHSTNDGGAGGAGGGALLLEVGGNLTYGADSEIDLSGNDGSAGTGGESCGSGGGGGGGGGIGKAIYAGTLTDNGLAKTVSGGSGGAGNGGSGAGGAGAAGSFDNVAVNELA